MVDRRIRCTRFRRGVVSQLSNMLVVASCPGDRRKRGGERGRQDRALVVVTVHHLDEIRAGTRQVGEARKLDGARLDAAARGRVLSGADAKRAGLVDELGGLQLALSIAKARAGIDETRQIEIRRYPDEHDRWQRLFDRLFRLVGVDAGPTVRAPREVREALARMGIVARPGNVRLPPLPPLWR